MSYNTDLATLFADVLDFVSAASSGTKMAVDEVAVHRAQQAKAAALVPPLLKQLIDQGLIAPHQKSAGEAMLAEHAGALQLLKLAADRLAAPREKKAAHEPGAPHGDSAASATAFDSQTDPYVGRRTSRTKASDEAILRVLD